MSTNLTYFLIGFGGVFVLDGLFIAFVASATRLRRLNDARHREEMAAWVDWAESKRALGREMAKNRDKRVIRP